jgi:hypothetical protein
MEKIPSNQLATRRSFLSTSVASAALIGTAALNGTASKSWAAPAIHTPSRGSQDELVIGEGDFRYRVDHNFCQLPDEFSWQTTHNVAVDSANNLYVIHEGKKSLKSHPSIFVFDSSGKFIRAFGSQFQGGGHGIEVRQEGSEEFLYVAAYQQVKAFAKMTLTGETVWYRKAPMESGVYADGQDTSTEATWTRKGFLPTNFAFLDDGGFLLADGYGSFHVHRYDKHANWVSSFGGPGEGKGTFKTAHGVWTDNRPGREPSIIVTDRAHNTLQYFTMDGKYIETLTGYGLPANFDTRENLLLVSELKSRLTILNEQNEVVAQLGEAIKRLGEIKGLREKPDQWNDGEFVHPHDACFDVDGNIFVAEWVATGRVTKLTHVA